MTTSGERPACTAAAGLISLAGSVFSYGNTSEDDDMAARKFAISVPEQVMDEVDRAAEQRGWTRSRFISYVLRVAARAQSDAAITRKVNELFADPELVREQRESAEAFTSARSSAGTKW